MRRYRPFAFVLAVLTAVFVCMPAAYASGEQYSSPVISSACGRISGKSYNGCVCYLGIPYGKATTGARRFSPPEPADPWDGVFEATRQPKDPVQSSYNAAKQSEDSLALDIWVPDHTTTESLPVMFWIFGGAYEFGGIGKSYYDLSAMANDTGCILVSANYRLGAYGFLDLRDVIPGATANNGLRDLTLALRWVNENIAAFGGDPANVTVFGQSAGAALALALTCVPETAPYFDKVISQSACLDSFYSPAQAKEVAASWLALMGNPGAEELCAMHESRLVSCNGKLDTNHVIADGIDCTFNPVIDGEFLVCHPSDLPPEQMTKKLLIGCTETDAALFLFFVPNILTNIPYAQDFILRPIEPELRPALTAGLPYPGTKAFITLTTERMYRVPMTVLADRASQATDVYAYRYDYQPPLVRLLGIGAFHATDVPVLLDSGLKFGPLTLKVGTDATTLAVGRRMREYWGNFAKTGVPGGNWTAYSAANRETLLIDKTDTLVTHPYGERMDLYREYTPLWKR